MKRFNRNTGLIFASWALLLVFGCHKKRPPVPPEQEPPTLIAQIPTEPTEPPDTQQQNPPTPEPETKPPDKTAHTPPKHVKHPSTPKKTDKPAEPEKPAPAEEARNIPPPKITVQEGTTNQGATPPSGAVPGDNSSGVQGTTQQLLDGAENNLRNIKRQLSSNEQAMVQQVNDYITQSKKATTDGDNVRAHILALKARLLSDELVKSQ